MAAKNVLGCLFRTSRNCGHSRWAMVPLFVLVLLMLVAPLHAQPSGDVVVLTFDGPVNPMLLSYLERGMLGGGKAKPQHWCFAWIRPAAKLTSPWTSSR